jgi:DNA-binding IclR family transcriptional regulator
MDARNASTRYLVPALERGLRLLQLLDGNRTEISAAEAARELQLPRASVFRIVKTLELMGYLRPTDGAAYALGPAVFQLGSGETPAQTGLPDSPPAGSAAFI